MERVKCDNCECTAMWETQFTKEKVCTNCKLTITRAEVHMGIMEKYRTKFIRRIPAATVLTKLEGDC